MLDYLGDHTLALEREEQSRNGVANDRHATGTSFPPTRDDEHFPRFRHLSLAEPRFCPPNYIGCRWKRCSQIEGARGTESRFAQRAMEGDVPGARHAREGGAAAIGLVI
jgi:hypothetical protein